jgi:hypothetical protein
LSEVKLTLERSLPLAPAPLARLAPAVERPGIHLGVWPDGSGLRVWGATRTVPAFCFVLEVISPGLLVVKHSRGPLAGKFANIAVLEGDQVKILDGAAASRTGTPALLQTMLNPDAFPSPSSPGDVMVRLAESMRAHGHGGALLVVPPGTETWRESVLLPLRYPVEPPFAGLRDLIALPADEQSSSRRHDRLRQFIDGIAGLTAVDGATVITERHEVLAFGATIRRRDHSSQVEEVLFIEPIEGHAQRPVPIVHLGGTRHQSAAQFVHDQRDAVALVASTDRHFSFIAWSVELRQVQVYRLDALLL